MIVRAHWYIWLSRDQMNYATRHGIQRNADAIALGLQPGEGFTGDPVIIHIQGAQAELAGRALFGYPLELISGQYSKSLFKDIYGIELRSAKPGGCLKIKPYKDDDNTPTVCVYRHGINANGQGLFEAAGWIGRAWDAKWSHWKADPGGRNSPAYFMPYTFLKPMSSIDELMPHLRQR